MEGFIMKKTIDLEKNKKKYLAFVESRKNLILNVLDAEGKPFTSSAPFVKKDGRLYIYISKIAEHYDFIEQSEYIDTLIIADEVATENKFATERARWNCTSRNIGNEGHDEIFALFNANFGKEMLDVLRGLDFSLFELIPLQGRYVVGLGKAFDVDIDANVFTHVVVDKK